MAEQAMIEVSAEEYSALPGIEGGGFMGCVFKYDEGKIVGRRSMNEGENTWSYHRLTKGDTDHDDR